MSEQPRRHQGADRAAVGQEPRAGQRRTKSALVRQERCLFWRTPAAKSGQGRHRRTESVPSGRLSAKVAKRIGGVPWTRADKMETKALSGAERERRGKREQSVLSPWSVVKVGLCGRDSRQGSPARPGQGPSQNDLRLKLK